MHSVPSVHRLECRLLIASHREAALSGLGRGHDVCRVTFGSVKPGFDSCFVPTVTNFHASFILLFELTPFFQNSLANSLVTA